MAEPVRRACGAVMGSDRFGLYLPGTATLEERVATLATLCGEGYADRIGLSHDCMLYSDWGPPGHAEQLFPTWVPTHRTPPTPRSSAGCPTARPSTT